MLSRLTDKAQLLAALGAFGASLAGLIAVAALYWSADRRADDLDLAINAPRVGYVAQVEACTATVAQQGAALETQNAALDQLARDAEARTKLADTALRKAQAEAKRYRDKAERIARLKPPTDDLCKAADAVLTQGLLEARK